MIALSVVGFLALVALAAGGGLYLYDKATTPDRSTPTVAVQQFLKATFVDRNQTTQASFSCGGVPAEITSLVAFVDDIKARTGTDVAVGWDSITAGPDTGGGPVNVTGVIILTAYVNNVMQEDRQDWRFVTEHRDGWRVCGAHKV